MKVEYDLQAWQDDASVRGNVIASDDADFDRECEDAVIASLEDGNVWAWASVRVSASVGGIECSDYLGCCNYKSEADFRADGYYLDMKAEALGDLRDEIEARLCAIKCAEKELTAERAAYDKRQTETETWTCTGCAYSVHVHPSERDEIGILYCADCDQEMERVA